MIVISNAFVFSTCLLVVVSRYGYMHRSFSRTLLTHLLSATADQKAKCCQIYTKIFPSFNPLGQFNKFRGRYFKKKYHKLKARGFPFFVTHASILTWDCLNQLKPFYWRLQTFSPRYTQRSATPQISFFVISRDFTIYLWTRFRYIV